MKASGEMNPPSKRSHHRGSSGTEKWPLKTKVDKNKLTIEPIEIDWQWQQLRKSMDNSNSLTNVNARVKRKGETVDSAISSRSIRVKRNGK